MKVAFLDYPDKNTNSTESKNNSLTEIKGIANLFRVYLDAYFATHCDFTPASGLLDRILHEIEPQIIESCLHYTQGNRIKAAEILGINRNTLRKKMIAYHIDTTELLNDK
jgi:two-component system nitrogen regulation response regulator GlnG